MVTLMTIMVDAFDMRRLEARQILKFDTHSLSYIMEKYILKLSCACVWNFMSVQNDSYASY